MKPVSKICGMTQRQRVGSFFRGQTPDFHGRYGTAASRAPTADKKVFLRPILAQRRATKRGYSDLEQSDVFGDKWWGSEDRRFSEDQNRIQSGSELLSMKAVMISVVVFFSAYRTSIDV